MQTKINKYSSTLFNITKDHDMIKTVVEQISIIKQLYKRYANFRLLCESKRIDNTLKHTILKNVLKQFDDIVIEFLLILINHQQTKYIVSIIDKFLGLAKKELDVNKIDIITAHPIDDEVLAQLFEDSQYTINNIIDSSVIGGMKIKHENTIIDNSVVCQLNQLKKTLHNM